jgi:hypothetical protein
MPNFPFRQRRSARRSVPALLGVAVVLLGGGTLIACSSSDSRLYAGPGEASSTASPTAPAEESASPPGLSASVRSALTALNTAEKAVPHSTAYHLVHDDEGEPEWEVKVAAEAGSEWAVTVSDDGGRVTDTCEDKTPDDNAGRLDSFQTPMRKAVRAAAHRHPRQDLHAVATGEDRQARHMWKVTFTKGTTAEAPQTRTLVDANTGEVVGAAPQH